MTESCKFQDIIVYHIQRKYQATDLYSHLSLPTVAFPKSTTCRMNIIFENSTLVLFDPYLDIPL